MKIDLVELFIFFGIFICAISAMEMAFYPAEAALFIGTHVPQVGYPMDVRSDVVSMYSDGNGSSQVSLIGIDLVELRPLCTGSMHPVFGCNSTVLAEPVTDRTEIHMKDIIAYEDDDGMLICHRVEGYDSENGAWILKGDANPAPDPKPVPKERMRYRIVAIIYTSDVAVSS